MPTPPWLTWTNAWPIISGIPGWIALGLAVKKHRQERTILQFMLRATHVEADENEPTNIGFGSDPMVRALYVTITNTGQKPITILELRCRWSTIGKDGNEYERESRDWVNAKLGEADHCFSSPHLGSKPKAVISAWAIDSTGKHWNASAITQNRPLMIT